MSVICPARDKLDRLELVCRHIYLSIYTVWSHKSGYHVRDTNSQCTPAIDSLGLDGSDRCPAYRRRCHELPCKVSSTHRCSRPLPMQLAMELILICVMPIEATPEELMLRAWARHTCNADERVAMLL